MAENKSKIVHAHLPEDQPFKTTLTAGSHELTADEPQDAGGNNHGPDPYDYLLMSLGSCTAMTVKMYARRKEWPLADLFVELRHHKQHTEDCKDCENSQSKIDKIEIELVIEGDLSDEQIDKLLNISKKCPVHKTLTGDINISSSIEHK